MKRHWPLVLAAALLVATNVAWAYVVLNNAVTATYQQDEAERVRVSRDQLLVLSNALLKDINLEQLRELARERLDSGTFIQQEDHRLFIDDLVFTFEHGRLVHVGDANETESVARDVSD